MAEDPTESTGTLAESGLTERSARSLASVGSAIVAAIAFSSSLVLGVLTVASRRMTDRPARPRARPTCVVLIPAHDEERVIGECLRAVQGFARGDWAPRVVVVADNCQDDTARVAAVWGAEVLVRDDPESPGKGEALDWAVRQEGVLEDSGVVFVLDADDVPDPDVLDAALAVMEGSEADIVQVAHISRAEGRDDRSALILWAAMCMNRVRPRGLTALGCATRLHGGGMALRAALLRDIGWPSRGVSEDLFATVRFLERGARITFSDQAIVWSRAATSREAERVQRLRWESGRLLIMREFPGIVRSAFRRRSRDHVAFAVQLLVPPLSVHVAVMGAGLALSFVAGARGRAPRKLLLWGAVLTAAYLAEGLKQMEDRELARKAILAVPRFLAWKLGVQAEALRHYRGVGWNRTPRD